VQVSDAFDLRMGKTPSRKNPSYWRDGNHDWVSIADLSAFGKYVGRTKERINDLAISESGIKPAPANTVLMSFKLSLGKASITTNPVYTNEAIMAFVDMGTYPVDPCFMYHQCRAKNWAAKTNRAVMGETLNKKTLSQALIYLPKLNKQKEIANKLDYIDEQIAVAGKVVSNLDALVKSRFVEMFGDTQHEHKTLSECCDYTAGGATPSMKHEEYYDGEIPFIKSGDVKGDIVERGALTLTEAALQHGGAKLIPGDSVLVVTRSALLKRKLHVALAPDPVVINQDIKAFHPHDGVLSSYLMWAIRSREVELLHGVRSVNTSSIKTSDLFSMDIPLPSLALQQEFADFVAQVDKPRFVALILRERIVTCARNSLANSSFPKTSSTTSFWRCKPL